MILDFPASPQRRRHGPAGYTSYHSYKEWLRDDFLFRCAFCLIREKWHPAGHASFSVDHLIPQSVDKSKALDYENLLYACLQCNSLKRNVWPISDPTLEAYGAHLQTNNDGTVVPLSQKGSILIEIFLLNEDGRVRFRARMLSLFRSITAVTTNTEAAQAIREFFGFPDDLPDLRRLRPPRNRRPRGISTCYFVLREKGKFPKIY
jgi:hypothetical protein